MASNHIGAQVVYSREFLLKFRSIPSCQDLPEGVDISSIIVKSARSSKELLEDKKKHNARGLARPKRDVKEKDKSNWRKNDVENEEQSQPVQQSKKKQKNNKKKEAEYPGRKRLEDEGINVEGLSPSELFELERKLAKEKNTKNSNKNNETKTENENEELVSSPFQIRNVEIPKIPEAPQLEKKVADFFEAANLKEKNQPSSALKPSGKSLLLGMQPNTPPGLMIPGGNSFKPTYPPAGTVFQLADIEKSASNESTSVNSDDKVNKVLLDIFKSVESEKEDQPKNSPAQPNHNLSHLNNFIHHSSPAIPTVSPTTNAINPSPLTSSSLPEPALQKSQEFDGNSLLAKLAAGMKETRHDDTNSVQSNQPYPFPHPNSPLLHPNFRNIHPPPYSHIPPTGQPHTINTGRPGVPDGFNPYLHQSPNYPRQPPPGGFHPHQQPVYPPGSIPHSQFTQQKQQFHPGMGNAFVPQNTRHPNIPNPLPHNFPDGPPQPDNSQGLHRFFPNLQMGVVHAPESNVTYKSVEEIEKNFT